MYKGIIVYDPISNYDNPYSHFLSSGFQKDWSDITLPHQLPDHCDTEILCSGELFLFYWRSMSFTPSLDAPVPIIGFVVPVHTNSAQERHDRTYSSIVYQLMNLSGSRYSPTKVLILVIDSKDPPDGDEFRGTDWWDEDDFWKGARHTNHLRNISMTIATIGVDELEKIPDLIAEHFCLSKSTVFDEQPTSKIKHPYLPNVEIDPTHLGVGVDASLHFVEDCLEGLIPTQIPIRIWIEATPTTIYDRQATYNETWYRVQNDKLGYITDELTSILAKPNIFPLSDDLVDEIDHETRGVWRVEPAYHVYLEYEHIAYDGMLGFQNHLAIEAYQHHLASGWFTTIDITPDMTLDEAKTALHEAVRRVKRGILD